MVTAVTRVAVLGAGRMGGAMAKRLAGHGYEVTIHNRTSQRAIDLAADVGAAVATTAREAVTGASTVVVSLADDAAVRAMYEGPDGLAAGVAPGTVVLETSTIAPATVRSLGPPLAERGADLLDAPVSGSVPLVEKGELTFLIGGPAHAVDRCRPVLDTLGARVFQLGPVGAGATMKLAVNAVVHGLNQALAEALVLAERAGVDRAQAYEVFAASAIGAPFVHYKRSSYVDPEATPVAFMLDLVAKDLALIDDLAAEVGARMDQVTTNRRIVEEAVSRGYGSRDLSALADLLRR
jgi:3-hydroxyisobutyrate dehydrogenase-like beta-hydroxyacid dehydrogenase